MHVSIHGQAVLAAWLRVRPPSRHLSPGKLRGVFKEWNGVEHGAPIAQMPALTLLIVRKSLIVCSHNPEA